MIKSLTSVMGVAFFPPFPPIFNRGAEVTTLQLFDDVWTPERVR